MFTWRTPVFRPNLWKMISLWTDYGVWVKSRGLLLKTDTGCSSPLKCSWSWIGEILYMPPWFPCGARSSTRSSALTKVRKWPHSPSFVYRGRTPVITSFTGMKNLRVFPDKTILIFKVRPALLILASVKWKVYFFSLPWKNLQKYKSNYGPWKYLR